MLDTVDTARYEWQLTGSDFWWSNDGVAGLRRWDDLPLSTHPLQPVVTVSCTPRESSTVRTVS
jgi:hypothetical protein